VDRKRFTVYTVGVCVCVCVCVWQRYLPKARPVGGSKQAHTAAIIANRSQLNDVTYCRTCSIRKKKLKKKRMQLATQTTRFFLHMLSSMAGPHAKGHNVF